MNALPAIPRDIIGEACARMQDQAAQTWDGVVAAMAVQYVAEPDRWRIAKVLGYGPIWPVEDATLDELLVICRRQRDGEITRGRTGHWSYSSSRHMALDAAHSALLKMMGGE